MIYESRITGSREPPDLVASVRYLVDTDWVIHYLNRNRTRH